MSRHEISVTIVLGLVLLVSACGFQLGQTKTSENKSPALDKMIDVGGYHLHINCAGVSAKGSPTVVMDAGGFDSSEAWSKVQPEIARFTRLCVYDRAGLGKSERRPNPSYTSQEIVNDLHTLLVKANIASPFVLVGHSFGGMNVRLYASQYPEEIVGMVLVDSVHEDEMDRWLAMLPLEAKQKMSDADKSLLARLAISEGQVRAARWHTDIPLVVLTHGIFNPDDYYGFPAMAAQGEKLRLELQDALSRLSSTRRSGVIKRTGTLSLPLLLTCILSMACSSAAPASSGISLPYVRHTRNHSTPIVFQGRVVGVQDGDTITVLDSSNQDHRIRLQGIDAPEKGQAFGTKSGENLSQAVFDKVVTVEWSKHDRYRRIVGKVTLDDRDICLEQVRAGMAWHYKYYQEEQTPEDQKLYADAEDAARSAKIGLWIDPNPVPPWDFRKDSVYAFARSKHWLKVKTSSGRAEMQKRIENWA